MTFSITMWIKEAWKQEVKLEGKSIKKEVEEALKAINVNIEFRENGAWLKRQQLEGEWKGIWKKLKRLIKKVQRPKKCKVKSMKK